MKSSSGTYYVGLDHLRGLAAFLVFEWHFLLQWDSGHRFAPNVWPMSFIAQGHLGVSLFMVLSGYLFAKLLDGKQILYRKFFFNRFLRLAPLFVAVMLYIGIKHHLNDLAGFADQIASGLIIPTNMPEGSGTWSIVAEFHFYLLLPFLVALTRWSPLSLTAILLAAILFRLFWFFEYAQVQSLAYYTIFGRIDQFLFGMIAFHYRGYLAKRHFTIGAAMLVFSYFYYLFSLKGGYFGSATSALWIVMPTIEGAFIALLVSYYDTSFKFSTNGLSGFLAMIGTCSYSIYLLHFFYFANASTLAAYFFPQPQFYTAMLAGLVAFVAFLPVAWLSFRFYEKWFLQFRKPYTVPPLIQKNLAERREAAARISSTSATSNVTART